MPFNTAIHKQYQEIYETYTQKYGPKVCVCMCVGRFYEFYATQKKETQQCDNNVKERVEFLGIQCATYPDEKLGDCVGLVAGFPDYTLDKWAGKLTQAGWHVVVVDQNPQTSSAGKIQRNVSRVLSPGTHVECAETNASFYLASVYFDASHADTSPPKFGVVALDLTDGETMLYEGQAMGSGNTWHADDLRHFFQMYPPREVVYVWRGPHMYQPDEEILRRNLYLPTCPIYDVSEQSEIQDSLQRAEFLRRCFTPKTSMPIYTWLHITEKPCTERALTFCMRFVEDHVSNLLGSLQAPKAWHPEASLRIVNNALQQLNILQTDTNKVCVETLFLSPYTAFGKRAFQTYLCTPIADVEELQGRQSKIRWFLSESQKLQQDIQSCLRLIYDLPRIHRKIVRGSIGANDIYQCWQSYMAIQQLLGFLDFPDSPYQTNKIQTQIEICLQVLQTEFDLTNLTQAMESPEMYSFLDSEKYPMSKESEKSCLQVIQASQEWLEELYKDCKKQVAGVSPNFSESIYFKTTEKNRFHLYTTNSSCKILEALHGKKQTRWAKFGIKQLKSGSTLSHPELDEFQERFDVASSQLQRNIQKEMKEACIVYASETQELWNSIQDFVTQIDLCVSFAKTSEKYGWIPPTYVSSNVGSVEIQNLRHPLIEYQKTRSALVTHNVSLGKADSHGWLLYGMNASGKSSLMKAVGIAVILAQVGCYVPATSMTISPFQKIATRILNQDNLWAGLSSFAVEMSELRDIFQVADAKTLVLGDELCSGTESVSATSIVAAGIQWLHQKGARYVLATHLHDLMKLPGVTQCAGLKVWHLHVEYDRVRDLLVYHRNLKPGPGNTLYGLEVARALHLPQDMIALAQQYRTTLLGSTTLEEAPQSAWNRSIVRKECEICHCEITKDLEVHHIQERHNATQNRRNQDGTGLHDVRNLVVLCEACHDAHHAGQIQIQPMVDTSIGTIRPDTSNSESSSSDSSVAPEIKSLEKYRYVKKEQFTEEEMGQIEGILKKHKGLHAKLLLFQIQKQYPEIKITLSQLQSIIKK